MPEYKYDVLDGGEVVASDMDLDVALLLLNALFEKYYKETVLMYSIRRHAD